MKFSKRFNEDFEWYLLNIDVFTFDGSPNRLFKYNKEGLSAKECFYYYDSQGILKDTYEPELLRDLFKCKGSINFQIKEWAQDRAKGYLPKIEFNYIVEEYKLLPWMVNAVEQQKSKYYD